MAEVVLDIEDLTMSIDEGSYCWNFVGTLADIDSWTLCEAGNTVTITLGTDVYICQIDSRDMTQEFGEDTYSFSGRSITSVYGEGATPLHFTWDATNMHSVINGLITTPIDIRIPNWNIPADLLVADGETPMSVVNRIAIAVGGILYTTGNGTLVVTPKHTTPPPLYNISTVPYSVSDLDDIFELNETRVLTPGYNQVEVTDEPDSDISIITIEQISLDAINLKAVMKAIVYPFVPNIIVQTSHNNIIINIAATPVVEQLEEVIEIVDGEGSVSKPVLSVVSSDWQDVNLGAFSTNGTSINTVIPGTSLLVITYTTQYHEFTVSASDAEQVQIYMED